MGIRIFSWLIFGFICAVASPAWAQFDGQWSGQVTCDNPPSYAQVPPLRHPLVVDVSGRVASVRVPESGGQIILNSGSIRPDGSMTLKGTDRHTGGEWTFAWRGLARGNDLRGAGELSRWMDGRLISLQCQIVLARFGGSAIGQTPPPAPRPVPPPPQAQPKPQPQPPPQVQPKPPAAQPPEPQPATMPAPTRQEVDDILRKACAGDRDAQFRSGELYEKGQGVPKSLVEAYRWYDLSQVKGHPRGVAARDALESRMSREEQGDARKPRQPGDPPCTQTTQPPSALPPLALYTAAAQGNLVEVKRLLQLHADPNAGNADGRTPLMAAAAGGHADVVKALLEGGANINAQSRKGESALMLGAGNGSLPIVQGLLDANADPLLRTGDDKNALDFAKAPPVRELLDEAIAKAQEARLNLAEEQRKKIQQTLTALGFDTRGAAGQFNSDTRQAIKAWQVAANQRATSYLTGPQAERLQRVAAPAGAPTQEIAAKWHGTWIGSASFSYAGGVPETTQTCRGEAVENFGLTVYPGASPTEVIVNLFGSRSVKDDRALGDGHALIEGRTSYMIPGTVEYATGTERRNAQGQPVGQLTSQRQLVKYDVQRAELMFAGKALRVSLRAQPVDANQRNLPTGAGWTERQYFFLDEPGQRVVLLGPGFGTPEGTREGAAIQQRLEESLDNLGRERVIENGKPSRACSTRPSALTILTRK